MELPIELEWHIIKFMRHPLADTFINDSGVRSALEHLSEWEDVYEGIEEFNFKEVMFSHVLCKEEVFDDSRFEEWQQDWNWSNKYKAERAAANAHGLGLFS
jgi:hypothetical protein